MYVHGIGWHHWDGTRWAEDERGEAKRAVADVLREALAEAVKLDSDQRDKLIADVRKCETANGIAGVLDLAPRSCRSPTQSPTSTPTVPAQHRQRHPRPATGEFARTTRPTVHEGHPGRLRPAARSEPGNVPRAGAADPDVRGYLQRLAGLSLLGKVVEHVFTVITGTGANGKGTAYDALLTRSATTATPPSPTCSCRRRPTRTRHPSTDGSARQTAGRGQRDRTRPAARRRADEEPHRRRPHHRPTAVRQAGHVRAVAHLADGHQLPAEGGGDDPAVWRRMRVIPFGVVIPPEHREGQLPERLELAADAVLAWAIAGHGVHRDGLDEPEAVRRATGDYKQASDAVARFIAECCYLSPHACALTYELFTRWTTWAAEDAPSRSASRSSARHSTPTATRLALAGEQDDSEKASGCWPKKTKTRLKMITDEVGGNAWNAFRQRLSTRALSGTLGPDAFHVFRPANKSGTSPRPEKPGRPQSARMERQRHEQMATA